MPLTFKDVAEIVKIIDASQLDEIVIELDGAKMQIRRKSSGGQAVALPVMTAGAPVAQSPPTAAVPAPVLAASKGASSAATAQPPTGHAVRAPMMGTFYRAPSPKDAPFVEVGSVVRRGDPLCLIEVMKLFTTIAADTDGRIAHILPANGDLVEFDQALFIIEPS